MNDSDEDQPHLSSTTLAALQEFFKEKEERESVLKCISDEKLPNTPFDEDWQLSQFWYDDKTIESFVRGTLNSTPRNGKVALVSCPTLYNKLKKEGGERQITLFEYDSRFKIFGADFVQYDYKFPLDVPRNLSSQFDLVIADPPFLSDECLTKTAVTIKFLTKGYVVLCTGAVMAQMAERLLDVRKCNFMPSHKNNLSLLQKYLLFKTLSEQNPQNYSIETTQFHIKCEQAKVQLQYQEELEKRLYMDDENQTKAIKKIF